MGKIVQFPGVTSVGSHWARLRREELATPPAQKSFGGGGGGDGTQSREPLLVRVIDWCADKLMFNFITDNELPRPLYYGILSIYIVVVCGLVLAAALLVANLFAVGFFAYGVVLFVNAVRKSE